MSDGVASIQARINEIEQRFVIPSQRLSARAPVGANGLAFAQVLDTATALNGGTIAGAGAVPTRLGAYAGPGKAQTFLRSALAQAGDPYVWGSTASSSDPNPGTFDCSELVKW